MQPWLWALVILALGCGPRTFKQRLLDAEKRAGEAEQALDEAERQMQALEPDAAAEQLDTAKSALANPDTEFYPERQMLRDRLQADQARMPAVRAERAKRDLERAVEEQRAEMASGLQKLRASKEGARAASAASAELDALRHCIDVLTDQIQRGQPLEIKHAGYARYVAENRRELDEAHEAAAFLKAKVAFLEGPAVRYSDGKAALERARAEKDRARRKELNAEAAEHFGRCATEGKERLVATPGLERTSVVIAEATLTAGAIVQSCVDKSSARSKQLKKAKPAKSSSKAKKKR